MVLCCAILVAWTYIAQAHRGATAYIAHHDIASGTVIHNSDIEKISIPSYLHNASLVPSNTDIEGKVSQLPIPQGALISRYALDTAAHVPSNYTHIEVPLSSSPDSLRVGSYISLICPELSQGNTSGTDGDNQPTPSHAHSSSELHNGSPDSSHAGSRVLTRKAIVTSLPSTQSHSKALWDIDSSQQRSVITVALPANDALAVLEAHNHQPIIAIMHEKEDDDK